MRTRRAPSKAMNCWRSKLARTRAAKSGSWGFTGGSYHVELGELDPPVLAQPPGVVARILHDADQEVVARVEAEAPFLKELVPARPLGEHGDHGARAVGAGLGQHRLAQALAHLRLVLGHEPVHDQRAAGEGALGAAVDGVAGQRAARVAHTEDVVAHAGALVEAPVQVARVADRAGAPAALAAQIEGVGVVAEALEPF